MIIPESPDIAKCDSETDEEYILLVLENLMDRVWLSVKSLMRRKRSKPNEWKPNISKLRKADGLSCITKGVTRSATVPKFIQCSKCSYKCTEKFSFEERNDLCRKYYNIMDYISKKNFILSCLKIKPVITRRL